MKVILTLMLAAITLSLAAQNTEEVVAEDDMFAPFRTIYRNIESVDFHASADQQTGSILKHHVARKHDMMNGKYYGGQLVHIGKIYRDNVNATRNSGGVTVSSDNSTVRTSTGRQGLTVSERNVASRRAQVDRQAAFAAARQEAIREARRVAARREYERKLREQAIDNQRAAQVEAQANARLQSITNARIARDYQNATVGTVKARETSKATANSLMQGPRPISASQPPRRTGAMTAEQLRAGYAARQRKPKVAYRATQDQKANSLIKPQPAVVRVLPNNQGEYEFTGRMTKTSIYIKRDSRFGTPDSYTAPKTVASNQGFRLSPNATVTTGRPVRIKDLEQREIPPRYPKVNGMSPEEREEMRRIMMYKEFFPEAYEQNSKS